MTTIAIIGSGPAGCFLAEILALKLATVQIDLYERLPHPFGLAVSGVAPDHPHTRKVTEQLQRTLDRTNVQLISNTQVGKDLSYTALKHQYDRVIFATGAFQDRQLGILGEDLQGVYGSGAFTRWYNSHPDRELQQPALGKVIAIIGNGNVALDIARVLAKTAEEHQHSALSADIREQLANSDIQAIHIFGRRGPSDASFTLPELTELGRLARAKVNVASDAFTGIDLTALPMSQQKVLQQLHSFADFPSNSNKQIQIHFHFYATPQAIEGNAKVHTLHLQDTRTGKPLNLAIDTLITAIGYQTDQIEGVPYDAEKGRFAHQDARIEAGVYCVGWCQRGPQGVIPTNRSEAMGLARKIIQELEPNHAN